MLRTLGTQPAVRPRKSSVAAELVPAPTEAEDLRPRVLLVEDNVVNQRVAVSLVSKRGYRVDVAQNGFEAIEATSKVCYVAVLMDCQMPKLDGYATTQHIRKREGDGARTPIIAMTANANAGDREKCLAAGMDDYVAKPVVGEELDRVLRQWAPLPGSARITTRRRSNPKTPRRDSKRPPAAAGSGDAAIDKTILDRLRSVQRPGDSDLVSEVIELFLGELPRRVDALRAAAGTGDHDALGRTAHTLKGSAGQVGATILSSLCGALERAVRARAAGFSAVEHVDAIGREAERVRAALDAERSSA